MALVRALNSAISGLRSQQFKIDQIGDNLANSTTTAFKSGRVQFATLLSQTLSFGMAPGNGLGGIDPMQIGLGTTVAETTRDFRQGELEVTGVNSDLAIEGDGFFILRDPVNGSVYTRDGSFSINPQNLLHNPANGFIVQGINANPVTFTFPASPTVSSVSIPIGATLATATSTITLDGNLNGGGTQALNGSVLESTGKLVSGSTLVSATSTTPLTALARSADGLVAGTSLGITGGSTITVRVQKGGRTLPDRVFLVSAAAPLAGTHHGAGTTLGSLMTFLQRTIGINTGTSETVYGGLRDNATTAQVDGLQFAAATVTNSDGDVNIDSVRVSGTNLITAGAKIGDIVMLRTGAAAGLRGTIASFATTTIANDTIVFSGSGLEAPDGINSNPSVGNQFTIHEPPRIVMGSPAGTATESQNGSAGGRMRVAGNIGTVNNIDSIQIISSNNSLLIPFQVIRQADGTSSFNAMTIFDSLGGSRNLEVAAVLEAQNGVVNTSGALGNVMHFFFESSDHVETDAVTRNRVAGNPSGRLFYSIQGQFQTPVTPLPGVDLRLNNLGVATTQTVTPNFSGVTGFANQDSTVFMADQNGVPFGTMTDFSVGADGTVTGIFTNGQTRSVSRIFLARFANPNGLTLLGGNLYQVAANSGSPLPNSGGQAGTAGLGFIRSGVLEASNVDLAREFTNLIISQRSFQANARVITTSDRLLEELVNVV